MAEHGGLDSLARTPCAKLTTVDGCQGPSVRKNLRSVKFCKGTPRWLPSRGPAEARGDPPPR